MGISIFFIPKKIGTITVVPNVKNLSCLESSPFPISEIGDMITIMEGYL
jgi:hypothetical protein